MSNGMKVLGFIVAAIVAVFAVNFVLGLVWGLLHWVIIAGIVLGIGYVIVALASPNRALISRRKILP